MASSDHSRQRKLDPMEKSAAGQIRRFGPRRKGQSQSAASVGDPASGDLTPRFLRCGAWSPPRKLSGGSRLLTPSETALPLNRPQKSDLYGNRRASLQRQSEFPTEK